MSPEVSDTHSRLSNPFSTGGGGVTFEHLVGASYLVSLLAQDVPRGLDRGITERVAFQRGWSGAVLDDIVVTSRTWDGQERRLALAVKHDLTFSSAESNRLFSQVVSDCWQTFTGEMGWPFDPDRDRIGIAIGQYSAVLDRHLQQVLRWARTADSTAEFSKIGIEGFSSAQMRNYVQVFRTVLAHSTGREISDDEMWSFLRCLVVLHFDFEHADSRDATSAWNRLLDQLAERDDATAKQLFTRLTSLVDQYARDAARLTSQSLRTIIAGDFPLRDQASCGQDLERLRDHSDRTLRRITTTIGGRLHLPRAQLLDETFDRLAASRVVIITGEPGVGKSVLLSSLADRLRQEGEVFAIGVEELSEANLAAFASHLHVENDFQTLLGAVSSAPFRCFLIDGLEKATLDPNRRLVLNDLIREVKRYNEKVISLDGHLDSCWRIVATCRAGELDNLLPHLVLREDLQQGRLQTIQVDGLTDEELSEVSETFPRLRCLTSQKHVYQILRRPSVLDFLTLPELRLGPQDLPEVFTEAWLMDWYWKEVIRLADGTRDGIGDPNAREQTMLRLGKHILETGQARISIEFLNPEAVTGLAIDRVIEREDTLVRLAHDVLEDWTAVRILESYRDGLPQYLRSCQESLAIVRPLRLLALRQLEEDRSPDRWLGLLDVLGGQEGLSPRWYQTVLTAPLFSPLLPDMLDAIEPHLLADDGRLLSEMLKAIRTISTVPSPALSEILAGVPQQQLDKYLAYARVPVVEQWLPLLGIILKHKDHLPQSCLSEIAEVFSMWMREPDVPMREEIGEISLDFLHRDPATARLFKGAALWAADCLPDRVQKFVYRALEERDPDLPELLLHDDTIDWVPLCHHLPEVLVDATERLLCQPLRRDRFGSYDWFWCSQHGIHNDHRWRLPPTYLKGPFLGLLRLSPEHGIRLVARITDYATTVWKQCAKREWGSTALPLTVNLSAGDHQMWGDELVYAWFRYPSVGPHGVTCALMALEYWMDQQITQGADPKNLFETVLSTSSSAAIAGVCISVALSDWRTRAEAAMPLLEQPAFWFMDRNRAVQEPSAAPFLDAFAGLLSDADRNIAKRMAEAPHRRLRIDDLAYAILLSGSNEAREQLQTAMKAFPESLPFFFDDERENAALVAKRAEACEFIAAAADPSNYDLVPGEEEGTFVLQFKPPEGLEARRREQERELNELGQIYRLLGWADKTLTEGQSEALPLEEALDLAQRHAGEDNPGVPPRNLPEKLRTEALALTAAALVECELDWARTNECLTWCRQQLLIAATRPEEKGAMDIPLSVYPWGVRRSAARGLPILLRESPRDTEIRRAILRLLDYPEDEVQKFLFHALRGLWSTDPDFVWRCIALEVLRAVRAPTAPSSTPAARLKARLWSLKQRMRAAVCVRMPRSLRNVSLWRLDRLGLSSVLYALPVGGPEGPLHVSPKHLVFIDDIMALTIRWYHLSHQPYHDHTAQWIDVPSEWSSPFFQLVANWALYLPPEQAEEHMLRPILSGWEQAPRLAEEFLRAVILLTGSRPESQTRFIQAWRTLVPSILGSPVCRGVSGRFYRELREVLGLVILYDPSGIVSWKVEFWEPILELVDLVALWVQVVGHQPEHFPSLVGMLRSIGLPLMSEHGIRWLSTCVENASSPDRLFDQRGVLSSLAALLHDAWYRQSDSLRADRTRWHQFVVLVDRLAARGEQVAVELQRKIQESPR